MFEDVLTDFEELSEDAGLAKEVTLRTADV